MGGKAGDKVPRNETAELEGHGTAIRAEEIKKKRGRQAEVPKT